MSVGCNDTESSCKINNGCDTNCYHHLIVETDENSECLAAKVSNVSVKPCNESFVPNGEPSHEVDGDILTIPCRTVVDGKIKVVSTPEFGCGSGMDNIILAVSSVRIDVVGDYEIDDSSSNLLTVDTDQLPVYKCYLVACVLSSVLGASRAYGK